MKWVERGLQWGKHCGNERQKAHIKNVETRRKNRQCSNKCDVPGNMCVSMLRRFFFSRHSGGCCCPYGHFTQKTLTRWHFSPFFHVCAPTAFDDYRREHYNMITLAYHSPCNILCEVEWEEEEEDNDGEREPTGWTHSYQAHWIASNGRSNKKKPAGKSTHTHTRETYKLRGTNKNEIHIKRALDRSHLHCCCKCIYFDCWLK